ncbi:MAG TPA: RyR domain-containing protein [bacterium]|nr:RyR domain-containing protein [bacterium]HQI48427.1 RyR domain-containing protein [bacterium]HQJ65890.1 RyR domain-containing protein [bacterium]
MAKAKPLAVVAGDALVDWFEASSTGGQARMDAGATALHWASQPRVEQWVQPGGSLLVADFLKAAETRRIISPAVRGLRQIPCSRIIHSYADVELFPLGSGDLERDEKSYRVKAFNGYSGPRQDEPAQLPIQGDESNADLVVLDDNNNGFRNHPDAWPLAVTRKKAATIILKTCSPIARGPLWDHLIAHFADRLITIVKADDLRLEGVHISRRLSWERTVKDLMWQYQNHPAFRALKQSAFLIVRFGVEGVVLLCNGGTEWRGYLYFDPSIGEESFRQLYKGFMPGMGSAFTAALAACVSHAGEAEIRRGIHHGLLCAREIWKKGFGPDERRFGYARDVFAPTPLRETAIEEVPIPGFLCQEGLQAESWSLLHDLATRGLEQAAHFYVVHGRDTALNRVPAARYRDLYSIDRSEIESYRSIHNLIHEYLNSEKKSKPLAVAVFGAPGSGKSFGIGEIAESVAPGRILKIEFNLSQFTSVQDLISAFHKIRDIALGGRIPLVFFDEFDSEFGGANGWLKFFLSPIQDGSFREGETVHPLPKSIFVFAGGIHHTFADFAAGGKAAGSDDGAAFSAAEKAAKLPDFISRLRGFIDIKGPNPTGADDPYYIIRRALLWRFLISSNARHLLGPDKKLAIDRGVLRALLSVPCYKHGVRSMLAILEMSMLANRRSFEPAALPSRTQLSLHVDADAFYDLVLQDTLLCSQIEKMALAIHEQYRTSQAGRKSASDPAMQSWEKLTPDLIQSNLDAAADIPLKLEALGYTIVPERGVIKPIEFNAAEVERLAIMEHERWNRQRIAAGWTLGERNHAEHTTPYLVPWEQLPEEVKVWDREAVQGIPKALADAGFRIEKKK